MSKKMWQNWWKKWLNPVYWGRRIDAYHYSVDMFRENIAYEQAREEQLKRPNVYLLSDYTEN